MAGYTVQVQAFGFGHLYVPFRPPVSDDAAGVLDRAVRHPRRHAGVRPDDAHLPDGTALALRVQRRASSSSSAEAARDRGSAQGADRHQPRRPGPRRLPGGDDRGRSRRGRVVSAQPPRPDPRPAECRSGKRGESDCSPKVGCAPTATLPDWHLPSGDRRFFDLQVAFNDAPSDSKASSSASPTSMGDRWVPRRGPVAVRGVYSDFKYHDVGPEFYQVQFDGSVVRQWRTTPLWGVGSTAPYGHDGANLDLDASIRRHGGEALASRNAYVALQAARPPRPARLPQQPRALPDRPAAVRPRRRRARSASTSSCRAQDTGLERFNPEWLFRVPGKIEGPVTQRPRRANHVVRPDERPRGVRAATCRYLKDSDGDGFPDVIDPAPVKPGFRDGVR